MEVDAPRGPLRFDARQQAVYNVYVREVKQVDGRWANEVVDTIPDVDQFWTYDPDEYLKLPPYDQLKGTWVK